MSAETAAGLAIAAASAAGAVFVWGSEVPRAARRAWAELGTLRRSRRAEAAAIEAGLDDPAFEPDRVRAFIAHVFRLAERFWRGESVAVLEQRADRVVLESWMRSWGEMLGLQTRVVGKKVDLLRVVNRPGEDEDRLVVRVRWLVRTRPYALADRADERWTLGRHGQALIVLAIEGQPLAGPALTGELIPTPDADTGRLREESLRELTDSDAQRAGDLAAVIDKGGDPQAALADLGLIDGRYSSLVIDGVVRHLAEAWEEATSGSDRPLRSLASPEAAATLLRPGRGRLRLRDAEVVRWTCTALRPPRVTVLVEMRAIRYLVSPETGAYVEGDDTKPRPFSIRWYLELEPTPASDWKLGAAVWL